MSETTTIVVVDDDPDDQLMILQAAEECDIPNRILSCPDGQALIDLLHDPDQPVPDMILLDINMPRMNGFEALQAIKSDPVLKSIPVIMLTTSRSQEDVLKSYELGCNSFVSKPVLFETLVELMNVMMKFWIEHVERADVQKLVDKQREEPDDP